LSRSWARIWNRAVHSRGIKVLCESTSMIDKVRTKTSIKFRKELDSILAESHGSSIKCNKRISNGLIRICNNTKRFASNVGSRY